MYDFKDNLIDVQSTFVYQGVGLRVYGSLSIIMYVEGHLYIKSSNEENSQQNHQA